MWRQLKKGEEGGNKRRVGGVTPAFLAPARPAPGSAGTQGDCFGKPSHSGCSNHSRSPEVSFHLSNVKSQKGQLPWNRKKKKKKANGIAVRHISYSGSDECKRRESWRKFKNILALRTKNRRERVLHQVACVLPSKCLDASVMMPSSQNCT